MAEGAVILHDSGRLIPQAAQRICESVASLMLFEASYSRSEQRFCSDSMSVISTSANLGSGSLRVSCAVAQLADIIITMAAKKKIFFIVLLAFAFMNRLQM